jgi:spermidine synthase
LKILIPTKSSVRIYIEDVAKWIRRPEAETNRYDLILHDVYSGGFVPPNLFTREFLSAIRVFLVLFLKI